MDKKNIISTLLKIAQTLDENEFLEEAEILDSIGQKIAYYTGPETKQEEEAGSIVDKYVDYMDTHSELIDPKGHYTIFELVKKLEQAHPHILNSIIKTLFAKLEPKDTEWIVECLSKADIKNADKISSWDSLEKTRWTNEMILLISALPTTQKTLFVSKIPDIDSLILNQLSKDSRLQRDIFYSLEDFKEDLSNNPGNLD